MRYEAKHSYFKRVSQSVGNFINVCHTLAVRHELLQCHYRLGESYCEDTLDVGPGKFGCNSVHVHVHVLVRWNALLQIYPTFASYVHVHVQCSTTLYKVVLMCNVLVWACHVIAPLYK